MTITEPQKTGEQRGKLEPLVRRKRWVEKQIEKSISDLIPLANYYQNTHPSEMATVMNIFTDLLTEEHFKTLRINNPPSYKIPSKVRVELPVTPEGSSDEP